MEKKRTLKSRFISMILALVLIMGGVGTVQAEETGSPSITVTLRYEGIGETYQYPQTVTLSNPEKTYEEEGITGSGIAEADHYTPIDAMIQFVKDMGGTPADEIGIGGWGTVNNFLGKVGETESLMFAVNNLIGDKGSDQYELHDGDRLVLYKYPNNYGYFTEENYHVSAGENMEVQVNYYTYDENWNQISENPSNARVLVFDDSGQEVDPSMYTAGTTDASGRAGIVFYEEGNYILAAEDKDKKELFSRPYARVTVEGRLPQTDEEKVSAAKEALTLGDVSLVSGDLTLPQTGEYQTTVTWQSSDHSLIEDDGTVHRPVGENKSAVLHAVIKSGDITAEKQFEITVKGVDITLKSLTVSPGALNYSPAKKEYTVYVKEDAAELDVAASAQEDVDGMVLTIGEKQYSSGLSDVNTARISLAAEETLIPVTITMGEESFRVTITVKKAKNPGEPLPDLPADWGQFLGDASNNAVVSSGAVTENGSLKWESYSNNPGSWGSYAGTPILVNDYMYAARNNRLEMLDLKDGHTVKSVQLASGLGFYSYITYGDGKIFVPLGDGSIQCFHAQTLAPLFLTERPSLDGISTLQAVSSIYYADGMIYAGYTNGAWTDDKLQGFFAAYDTMDIDKDKEDEAVEPAWTYGTSSHYGAGSVVAGDYVIFGGDDGKVISVNRKTGQLKGSFNVSGKVRCIPVYADGYIWLTTQGGWIYKLELEEDGSLVEAASGKLPATSSAAPVVSGGRVYVTGGTFSGGFVAVYDSNLKELAQASTQGQCNTPTLTTAYDDVYLYFTQNSEPGGIYVAKITANNKITVQTLYTPVHENYSMSKVLVGKDGTIYFTNDDGYIYAVEKKAEGEAGGGQEEETGGQHNPGGVTPVIPPASEDPAPAALPKAEDFTPKKRTIKAAAKKPEKKSENAGIEDALEQSISEGKKTLTVKNVPETIEPAVFSKLASHPDLRLVLDCQTYTISIKGSDVKNPEASLNTKLEETDSLLPKEETDKLGNYQQLLLDQDGPFPGKITIVYRIPAQLEEIQQLYLYANKALDQPEDVTVQKQYAMFMLENPGAYILSDTLAEKEEAAVLAAEKAGGTDAKMKAVKQNNKTGMPAWGWLILCGILGVILGTGGTWFVMNKRKKAHIWVEE